MSGSSFVKPNIDTTLYLYSDDAIKDYLGAGVLSSIVINSGGSGYTSAPTVVIIGDGSGAQALATITPSTIVNIVINNGGSGYTSAPTVVITGGGGTGATATASLTGAVVSGITITNGGSGYTSVPTITFSGGGGTGATATAIIGGAGHISSISIINGGTGYKTAPAITFSGGGGSGGTATSTINTPATICYLYRWNIPEINLNDAGEISMVGKMYSAFTPINTFISTRIKNVSTKYTIDTKKGDGAILNVSAWDYLSPFNECPPVPLAPQTINDITLNFQDEASATKGLVDANCRFVVVLKIREYDVPETRWGNTNAVNVRQMSIPTYNSYN